MCAMYVCLCVDMSSSLPVCAVLSVNLFTLCAVNECHFVCV